MKTSGIHHLLCRSTLSVAFLFSSLPAAQALTYYWDQDGTTPGAGSGATLNGTWDASSGASWNSDVAGGAGGAFGTVPTSSDTAYFVAGATTTSAGTTSFTVGLGGASVEALGLTFTSTAPVVIGSSVGDGTITLGTGGISTNRNAVGSNTANSVTIKSNINLGANQTWTQNTGVSTSIGLTLSGDIGGTGNLILISSANRPFILSGNVNHTGSIAMGLSSNTVTISGNIGSNVTSVSAGNTGTLVLSGNNSYTGNTTIAGSNSGTAVLRVGSNTAIVPTSTITLNSSTAASQSRLDLGNGANSFNATVAGLLTAGSGRQGRSVVTNSSSGTGTGTLTINPATANTFNGLIQDGGTAKVAISVGGADTLTLSGVNSHTGGTTVSSGTLAVSANAASVTDVTVASIASGTATQTATVADTTGLVIGQTVSAPNLAVGTFIIGITSGTTLQLSAFAASTGTQSGTFSAYQTLGNGPVTISGGTLSATAANLNTDAFTMSSGNLNLNAASAGTVTLASGANLTMTGGTWFWSNGDQFIGSGSGTFAISGVTLDLTGVTEGTYVLATGFDPVGTNSAEFFSENLGAGLSAFTSITDGVLTLTVSSGGVSNNANLSSLVVNTATLSPSFDSATISYTASVPYATTSVSITPTKAQAGATITVNGNPVTSGSPSGSVPLDEGLNIINTVVTAEDGTTTKTYNVTVTRQAPATLTDWRLAWYDTTENSGNAADTASPYGTGISNLFVYAFMGPSQDPATAKSNQLPQFVLDATHLSFTFDEPAGASGLTYGAEYRTDLISGSWLPVSDTGSGTTHIFSVPRGSNAKLFLRLTVTPSP